MKQEMIPPISVITVVRNAVSHIGECIESVLAQKIERLEYIIIDGVSTDGTIDVIRSYGDCITHFVSEPDNGLYDAMNKGLSIASGKFIHFLNADDRYAEADSLRKLLPKLNTDFICHAQMIYVDEVGNKRLLGKPYNRLQELKASHMPQPVMFVPRSMYKTVGIFDINYQIAADYEMVLRLTQYFETCYIPQPVTIMKAGGISFQRPDLAFKESMYVARIHGRSWFASRYDFYLKHTKWFIKRFVIRFWWRDISKKKAS